MAQDNDAMLRDALSAATNRLTEAHQRVESVKAEIWAEIQALLDEGHATAFRAKLCEWAVRNDCDDLARHIYALAPAEREHREASGAFRAAFIRERSKQRREREAQEAREAVNGALRVWLWHVEQRETGQWELQEGTAHRGMFDDLARAMVEARDLGATSVYNVTYQLEAIIS